MRLFSSFLDYWVGYPSSRSQRTKTRRSPLFPARFQDISLLFQGQQKVLFDGNTDPSLLTRQCNIAATPFPATPSPTTTRSTTSEGPQSVSLLPPTTVKIFTPNESVPTERESRNSFEDSSQTRTKRQVDPDAMLDTAKFFAKPSNASATTRATRID